MILIRYSAFLFMLIIFFSLRSIAQGEFYQINFELYRGTSTEFSNLITGNFVSGGNAGIDNSDLPKTSFGFGGASEKLSIYRNQKDFDIETRPLVNCTDTLFLRLYGTPTTTTTFRIVLDMYGYPVTPGLSAVLQDQFLNTERSLKFGDTTQVNFSVTSNTSSSGLRFRVVFRRTQVQTASFTQIPPICRGEAIQLPTSSSNDVVGTWAPAVNNTQTTTYTFLPSEGQCATSTVMTVQVNQPVTPAFNPIGPFNSGTNFTLPSTSNNGINGNWSPAINNTKTTTYTFTPDAGQCATTAQVTVTINDIVTSLSDLGADQSFKLYPNPAQKGVGTLQFELGNYMPGKYVVAVYTLNGILLKNLQVLHSTRQATYSISLDETWGSGTYLLRIAGEKNIKAQKILFIK